MVDQALPGIVPNLRKCRSRYRGSAFCGNRSCASRLFSVGPVCCSLQPDLLIAFIVEAFLPRREEFATLQLHHMRFT